MLHLYRRKKVTAQVKLTWPGNDIPKLQNNSTMQRQVQALVDELIKKNCCSKHFGATEIRLHIMSCLNERRRRVARGEDLEKVCVYKYMTCHLVLYFSQNPRRLR